MTNSLTRNLKHKLARHAVHKKEAEKEKKRIQKKSMKRKTGNEQKELVVYGPETKPDNWVRRCEECFCIIDCDTVSTTNEKEDLPFFSSWTLLDASSHCDEIAPFDSLILLALLSDRELPSLILKDTLPKKSCPDLRRLLEAEEILKEDNTEVSGGSSSSLFRNPSSVSPSDPSSILLDPSSASSSSLLLNPSSISSSFLVDPSSVSAMESVFTDSPDPTVWMSSELESDTSTYPKSSEEDYALPTTYPSESSHWERNENRRRVSVASIHSSNERLENIPPRLVDQSCQAGTPFSQPVLIGSKKMVDMFRLSSLEERARQLMVDAAMLMGEIREIKRG